MESKVVKDFIIHFYSIYSPSNKLSCTTWIGSYTESIIGSGNDRARIIDSYPPSRMMTFPSVTVIKNKNFHLKYSSFNIPLLFWNKWVRFLNFQQLSKFNYFIFPARSIARESCWRRYSWLKSSQTARRSSIFIR